MKLYWVDENATELIEEELAAGGDINEMDAPTNSVRKTLLQKAAWEGNLPMVRFLLGKQANPNLGSEDGYKPIHAAVFNCYPEIVECLILADADLNAKNPSGATPIKLAEQNGDMDMIQLLLDHGADIDIQDNEGYSPLCSAAAKGEDEMYSFLLENGANPNLQTNNHLSPMFYFVLKKKHDLMRKTIAAGADVNLKGKVGQSLLKIAAQEGENETMQILLDAKADINIQDDFGFTPLMSALSEERYDSAEFLLEKGADPNIPTNDGFYPLHYAILKGRYDMVEMLLAKGAKINVPASEKYSLPLRLAVIKGDKKIVNLLLDKGADIDDLSFGSKTALVAAVTNENLELVDLLLTRGANPNLGSVLGLAATNGFKDIVRRLLQGKADTSRFEGHYPPAFFYMAQHPELQEIFEEFGVKWDARDGRGSSILHFAAIYGKADFIHKLIEEKSLPVDCEDNIGETPLQRAIKEKQYDAVKALLEKGANPNHKRQDEITPYHLAVLVGDVRILKEVLEAGADPYVEKEGNPPTILRAVSRGDIDVIKTAMPYLKKNPEAWNKLLLKMIYRAIRDDKKDVLTTLLEDKDINTFELFGKNLLMHCVGWENMDFFNRLLEWGADINAKTEKGGTALVQAAMNDQRDFAGTLLEKGADPNVMVAGRLLLSGVAFRGKTAMMQILLENGAQVDAASSNGETALFSAAKGRSAEGVRLLLARGANPNAETTEGKTPLVVAINDGLLNVAVMLLQKGADANSVYGERSLLEKALLGENDGIAVQLIKYGAQWDLPDSRKDPLIELAIKKGCVKTVQLMFQKGAELQVSESLEARAELIENPQMKECVLKYGRARVVQAKKLLSHGRRRRWPRKSKENVREN